MKKLVFKKWVEMVVAIILSIGTVGFIFSCLGGLQKAALIFNGLILINIVLLGLFGRKYEA